MADIQRPTVLIVDDEENIRDAIAFNLKREGFDILVAGNGQDAIDLARKHPDVVLLDVMLPGIDGLEVLRRIRTESHVPVLMISARGDEIDRVVGLEIGADDYITKPFAMRELIARVRAMVRRMDMAKTPAPDRSDTPVAVNGSVLEVGKLKIDLASRSLLVDGTEVELNPKEFDLLVYLAKHPGVVMTREALLREVWGYEYRVDTRTVDVHIRWLRLKLESTPGTPRMFVTVRGSGYKFVPGGAGE